MTEKRFKGKHTKFGYINIECDEKKETQWRTVRVIGIEYIFKILCLICKIMIYKLPVHDSIDRKKVNKFKEELNELQ